MWNNGIGDGHWGGLRVDAISAFGQIHTDDAGLLVSRQDSRSPNALGHDHHEEVVNQTDPAVDQRLEDTLGILFKIY